MLQADLLCYAGAEFPVGLHIVHEEKQYHVLSYSEMEELYGTKDRSQKC